MKQRIKIYTTYKSHWIKSDLPFIADCLNKSKGREVEYFDIETVRNLKPLTFVDQDGDRRIAWDWFQKELSDRTDPVYNVICLHISPQHKSRWKLSKDIGGSYRNDPDPKIEFWLSATDKEAQHYTISDFQRKFLHEMLHGDTYHAGTPYYWKGKPRDFVHKRDYTDKAIHEAPAEINYTAHNTMVRLVEFYNQLIDIYAKITDRPAA